MSVRAKFAVQSREETTYGWGIKLAAVTGGGASEENKKFFKATPNGNIELRTVNEEAAAQFTPGKEFYIDFTPADPG